ncbi:beta-galactosidase family protein [Dyella sp.]|uniref:glycoside hydrolase family 35 protein n=1 Tax=Dyella sp. TaxID=1869338 RepID=UPI002ED4AE43
MKRLRLSRVAIAAAALALVGANLPLHANPVVTVSGDHFMREGKPYQIISGEMHFQRIPRPYWTDRLRKAKAMGLNTVTTYVFWNLIEPEKGRFDFTDNNDVAAFVKLAQHEGLNVILRPGPYICGEWDAGGYPAWLWTEPGMRVRSRDPRFLDAAESYLQHLGKQLAPLMASHGGPIIATELENEYGSYDDDKDYLKAIRERLQNAGLADDVLMTYDGPDALANGTLPDVTAVIDFAPGQARESFAALARFRPQGPRMAGEYWTGWFDKWGGKHAKTDPKQEADEVAWMLGQGYSLNMYMFHGGTNFGFMGGANYQYRASEHYGPMTTSYDYDAPLDEAGRITPKYELLREAITTATGRQPPEIPASTPVRSLPSFVLNEAASLWDNLPPAQHADQPLPMENYGQSYGYILYRTTIHGPFKGTLYIGDVRDYAAIYVDRKSAGTVDRRLKQVSINLDIASGEHALDVLVENTGRVNFGPRVLDGHAGLIDPVMLGNEVLHDWQVFPLPMTSPDTLHGWTTGKVEGPAFHRGSLDVTAPADTFLDTRAFDKGFAWLNGHNLGRIWSIGPQRDLYAPGPWFKKGANSVVVFDFGTPANPQMRGLDKRSWTGEQVPEL